jgi:uncharacterized protein YeaO (DUF488 family)
MLKVERVYDAPSSPSPGRFWVERLWPRGMKKERLHIDDWLKDVAPSDELRRWFQHDPARWDEFRRRYFVELDGRPEVVGRLRDAAKHADVTLLYSARDQEHNNAVALKEYLETSRQRRRKRRPTSEARRSAAPSET